jgi:predicted ATPase/DNA-binding winged helix-turn-helix (wHTH) protein
MSTHSSTDRGTVPLFGGSADLSQQLVVIGGRTIRLTTKERDLLAHFACNPRRTITRQELLVKVWGNPAHGSDEPVYSAVKRLRAKIDRGGHRHIVGVHGDGYRFEPPAPTSDPAMPAAGTRFFGRADELRAISTAYASGARLVTLVGAGGAGKTRCAQQAMLGRASAFCDLSNATTRSMIITCVAAALDVPLDGVAPEEWARGLGRMFAASPDRLVVLDNAEHAVEIVAALVEGWLLAGATLLVTSREPLRVRGELVIALDPLAPEDAVALFADRASASGADPGAAEVQALIVERVDRLPLAIELAAAQVREIGAKALLDSLEAQLATLVAGPRDAPSRHVTLRAAVDWSWTLLEPREREVLGQLSMFEGSFTVDGARAVVDGADAVAVLASLRRRCQIRKTHPDRFVLYAAVRELARERMADRSAAEARHAAWVSRVGTRAAALLEGPKHAEGAELLSTELAELRAAWKRALDRDGAMAARLALVLDRALALRGEKGPVRREILDRSRQRLEDPVLVGELLLAEGRIDGAPLELLDRACELATNPRVEAEIRLARGERLVANGLSSARLSVARNELERVLELAETSTDALRGRALAGLGQLAWAHGRVSEASGRLRAALEAHVRAGDRRAIARTSALLAHVDRLETGGGVANDFLRQAQVAAEELGEPLVRARVLMDVGQHLTRIGDQAGARAALAEAASLYERADLARDRAFLHLHVAETQVGIGDFEQALRDARAALTALPDAGDVGRATIYEAIGCIHLLRSELTEAERWIEDGLTLARTSAAARSECTLLGKRGLLHLVRGATERAWDDFDGAATKNEARGAMMILGESLADRAMASLALGQEEPAQKDLARARRLLHDPPPEAVEGRMLALCEIVGRGFGSVRAGAPPKQAESRARDGAAKLFDRLPPQEWDVIMRLGEWLVGRIAA